MEEKKLECVSCGATFADTEPKCPFCGSFNFKGAEKEYMEKLEDVRDDLEDLANIPARETVEELKQQGKFLKKIFLGIFIAIVIGLLIWAGMLLYDRMVYGEQDDKADYIWTQENLPTWNALYAERKYQELKILYEEAVSMGQPAYLWEHSYLMEDLIRADEMEEAMEKAAAGTLSEQGYAGLFFDHCKFLARKYDTYYPEEDLVLIEPYIEQTKEDLKTFWGLDEAAIEALDTELQTTNGPIYSECKKFAEEWRERNGR